MTRRYAPLNGRCPAPVDQDEERAPLVTDLLSEEELEAVWQHLLSEPMICHHPDTSLGHLWDTAVAERRKRRP